MFVISTSQRDVITLKFYFFVDENNHWCHRLRFLALKYLRNALAAGAPPPTLGTPHNPSRISGEGWNRKGLDGKGRKVGKGKETEGRVSEGNGKDGTVKGRNVRGNGEKRRGGRREGEEKGKGGKGKASSPSWNHVSVTVITSLQNYNSIISQLLNHIQVAFAALATALRRTIFCRRKCVDQTHASAGGDVIKPGGFIRSSIWAPSRRVEYVHLQMRSRH